MAMCVCASISCRIYLKAFRHSHMLFSCPAQEASLYFIIESHRDSDGVRRTCAIKIIAAPTSVDRACSARQQIGRTTRKGEPFTTNNVIRSLCIRCRDSRRGQSPAQLPFWANHQIMIGPIRRPNRQLNTSRHNCAHRTDETAYDLFCPRTPRSPCGQRRPGRHN